MHEAHAYTFIYVSSYLCWCFREAISRHTHIECYLFHTRTHTHSTHTQYTHTFLLNLNLETFLRRLHVNVSLSISFFVFVSCEQYLHFAGKHNTEKGKEIYRREQVRAGEKKKERLCKHITKEGGETVISCSCASVVATHFLYKAPLVYPLFFHPSIHPVNMHMH